MNIDHYQSLSDIKINLHNFSHFLENIVAALCYTALWNINATGCKKYGCMLVSNTPKKYAIIELYDETLFGLWVALIHRLFCKSLKEMIQPEFDLSIQNMASNVYVNSLKTSDTIWHHNAGLTLFQEIAATC